MPSWGRAFLLCAAASIALALGPAAARADDRADARQHFQTGKRHHDAGAWDAALGEYLRAYQLDANPAFLFNIGQVYRLKGERAKALEYYQRYLEAVPRGKGSDEARQFAAQMKAALDAEAAAQQAAADAEARRQAEAARAGDEAEQRRLAEERQAAEAARVAAAEARHSSERRLRIAGIASAAAGVVGIGLGVKFGLDARDRGQQVSDPTLTQWTADLDRAVDDGKNKNLAMEISVAIGSALVAAGGILFYLGRSAGDVKVEPVVGPGRAGAVVGWGF